MSCPFPVPIPIRTTPCASKCDTKCTKKVQVDFYLEQDGSQYNKVYTPLRQENNQVGGFLVVQSGQFYSKESKTSDSLLGQYTFQLSYITVGSEQRGIYDAWLVFQDASQSIHLSWYSKNTDVSINGLSDGLGTVNGGTGFYTTAQGQVVVSVVGTSPSTTIKLRLTMVTTTPTV